MKTFFFLIVFSSLCFSQSEFLDFKFYDSNGNEFHTLNLKQELDVLNKFDSKPLLLLYVTNSQDNAEYKQQVKYLKDIDAERLQLLFVDSNTDKVFEDGYHTDKNTALKLLGSGKNFKVFLLDGKGKVLYKGNKAISGKDIEKILYK
jgi:hypothetical protein